MAALTIVQRHIAKELYRDLTETKTVLGIYDLTETDIDQIQKELRKISEYLQGRQIKNGFTRFFTEKARQMREKELADEKADLP